MGELLWIEKLIAGLKASKGLHHKEWNENEYTIKDVSKSIAVKVRNWFQNVRF